MQLMKRKPKAVSEEWWVDVRTKRGITRHSLEYDPRRDVDRLFGVARTTCGNDVDAKNLLPPHRGTEPCETCLTIVKGRR